MTLSAEATIRLRRNPEPFQTAAAENEHFANLPEVLQYGFRRVLLFPLRAGDSLLSFLTLGRTNKEPFDVSSVEKTRPVSRVVAAVLERDSLQTRLKERKVVERAKGIVQERRGISEEEAYTMLRTQSRRVRRTVAEIAQEIIEASAVRKTA